MTYSDPETARIAMTLDELIAAGPPPNNRRKKALEPKPRRVKTADNVPGDDWSNSHRRVRPKGSPTIYDLVDMNARELQALDSNILLYRWARKNTIRTRTGFRLFKIALAEILNIDYDALRAQTEERKRISVTNASIVASTTPLLIPPDAIMAWKIFSTRNPPGLPHDAPSSAATMLGSSYFPGNYRAGKPIVAACLAGTEHKAPDEACKCGIYASTDIADVLKFLNPGTISVLNNCHVVAKVALWGPMYPTKTGFRSRFAYPIELYTKYYTQLCEQFGPTYPLDQLGRR